MMKRFAAIFLLLPVLGLLDLPTTNTDCCGSERCVSALSCCQPTAPTNHQASQLLKQEIRFEQLEIVESVGVLNHSAVAIDLLTSFFKVESPPLFLAKQSFLL